MSSRWKNYLRKEFQDGHRQSRYRKWESRYEESQDYETLECNEWRKHTITEHSSDDGRYLTVSQKRAFLRWGLITLVGFISALFGIGIHMATITLVNMKNDIVTKFMYSGRWGEAFGWHFAFALLFATLSYLFVYYEPAAAGSGIPEIKSYLNGVHLDKVVRLRTLLAKCGSVIFCVSSGLFAGPEGPMVHIGAIVGASVSRFYTDVVLRGARDWTTYNTLKNDAASRDFVTYGAAAGIAAAFRAPIGGVLFILEEGASFWSTKITWRAFFCSSVTLLTVIIIDRALDIEGEDMTSNFSFGKFSETVMGKYPYLLIELSLFFLLGCMGGVLGALFVHFNAMLTNWRKKYILHDYRRRLMEVLVIASLTSWMTFTVPLTWNLCSKMPSDFSDYTSDEKTLIKRLVQFDCPANHYNQVASLFYVDSNTAIKLLFHFREHMSSHTFDTGTLVVVFIPYFILAVATCGIMASAGVFVSCLVSGAVMGRLVGHLLQQYFEEVSDSGTYALVGAAAMIGGVCRNTISLTVMLVESTGNLQYVLPIMLALLSAKYIGDMLTTGLYDRLVILRNLPWLPEALPDMGMVNFCPVSEFMATPVVYMKSVERVGNVYETLQTTTHNFFPVIGEEGNLIGGVTRSTLLGMLQACIFSVPMESSGEFRSGNVTLCPVKIQQEYRPPASTESLTLGTSETTSIHHCLTELLTPHQISVQVEHMGLWMDFRAFMDSSPYVILESASVTRAFRMFRTLGLRHLVVISSECKVSGILSRKDVIHSQIRGHKIKRSDMERYFPLADQLPPVQVPAGSLHVDHITVGSSYHPTEEYGIELSETADADAAGTGLLDQSCTSDESLNRSSRYGRVNLLTSSNSIFDASWHNI